jgi:biopolymer transport protein ExbD
MGDIAFLLLIFFIITSSFIIRQGLFLSLPPFGGAAVRVEKNQLIDIFPRDNGFGLDNKVIDRKAFKTLLSDRASADPATVLRINMEAKIRYDRLMDALSVAKEVGLTRISLRNEGSMR